MLTYLWDLTFILIVHTPTSPTCFTLTTLRREHIGWKGFGGSTVIGRGLATVSRSNAAIPGSSSTKANSPHRAGTDEIETLRSELGLDGGAGVVGVGGTDWRCILEREC